MEKFKLPIGVADYIGGEAEAKFRLESQLWDTFVRFGYDRIATSALVPYSLYAEDGANDPKLFKISDTDGSLLVLRADMTMPLARIAATKLNIADKPVRLSYVADSYSLAINRNSLREFTQAGVELFNVKGVEGDAEVIALAIRALLSVGLSDFQIDIGEVGVLKGILSAAALTETAEAELIAAIDKKTILLKESFPNLSDEILDAVNRIALLYGGTEVIHEARSFIDNPESLAVLANLEQLYEILCAYGYGDYITFDLGLVNSFSYYSGVVFKGITRHFGAPLLGGGRYDKLSATFSRDIAATGFAIGISRLTQALKKQGGETPKCIITVIGAASNAAACLNAVRENAERAFAKGYTVKILYSATNQSINEYAADLGAAELTLIGADGRAIL